jgi:hypothetical protein
MPRRTIRARRTTRVCFSVSFAAECAPHCFPSSFSFSHCSGKKK